MAVKRIRPKTENYGRIERGASLTIPVRLISENDTPIDLTGTEIAFTIKKRQYDFDAKDDRAYVKKNFAPQSPLDGRFFIQLSSKDTDFEPGIFYFDIQICRPADGLVYRIITVEFELAGGPTNRTVNTGLGQLPVGDEISVLVLPVGKPITIISPIITEDALAGQSSPLWNKLVDLANQVERQTRALEELQVLLNSHKDTTQQGLNEVKQTLGALNDQVQDHARRIQALGG